MDVRRIIQQTFPKLRILVIGDVMVDEYVSGACNRVSPEGPVLVVHIQDRFARLGGAANVAGNLAALTVQTELAGFCGSDDKGGLLKQLCLEANIGSRLIHAEPDVRTTVKTRIMSSDKQVVRLDEETVLGENNTLAPDWEAGVVDAIRTGGYDCVILSDYRKGVLTPGRTRRFIEAGRAVEVPVLVDPKGHDPLRYSGASLIKPNRHEFESFCRELGIACSNIAEAASEFRERGRFGSVLVTLGPQGLLLVNGDGAEQVSSQAQEVFDVSGAGDTVMAAFASAVSAGLSGSDAAALASIAAAYSVARVGTTTVPADALVAEVARNQAASGAKKLFPLEELESVVRQWRHRSQTVAFTNGCFDLIHAGHIHLLEGAAQTADRLVVGLNSDDSIRRLKGEPRPFLPLEQRARVLSAMECVDALVVFEDDTPAETIAALLPDVLVKGGDYDRGTIVGADTVERNGGKVVIVPLHGQVSTTSLAGKIGLDQ